MGERFSTRATSSSICSRGMSGASTWRRTRTCCRPGRMVGSMPRIALRPPSLPAADPPRPPALGVDRDGDRVRRTHRRCSRRRRTRGAGRPRSARRRERHRSGRHRPQQVGHRPDARSGRGSARGFRTAHRMQHRAPQPCPASFPIPTPRSRKRPEAAARAWPPAVSPGRSARSASSPPPAERHARAHVRRPSDGRGDAGGGHPSPRRSRPYASRIPGASERQLLRSMVWTRAARRSARTRLRGFQTKSGVWRARPPTSPPARLHTGAGPAARRQRCSVSRPGR